MNYRYYKSDFAIVMTIKAKYIGGSDGQMPITTAYPFTFRFFIKGKQSQGEYVASFDGENTTNCQILDEKSVIVYFDRTILELGIGELMVETSHDITDAHFEGDDHQNVKRFYSTDVTLTDKPDLDYDEEKSIDITLLPLIIRGASGDAATQAMLDRANEAIQNANDAAEGLATQITNIENYCIRVNEKSEEAVIAADAANRDASSALERVSTFSVDYNAKLLTKYEKPVGGIPLADLSQDVKEAIQNAGKADGTTIVKNADNTLSVKDGVFATKEDIAEFETKANNAEQSATAAQTAAESAASSASSAQESAQQAANNLSQIKQEIAEMEADPDTDAALVAKVAKNTAGLNDLASKMSNVNGVMQSEEDGFFVPDPNGNIGMMYGVNGFDAAEVAEHFVKLMAKLLKIDEKDVDIDQIKNTVQNGLYFGDGNLNVGFKYDASGLDAALLSEHFQQLVRNSFACNVDWRNYHWLAIGDSRTEYKGNSSGQWENKYDENGNWWNCRYTEVIAHFTKIQFNNVGKGGAAFCERGYHTPSVANTDTFTMYNQALSTEDTTDIITIHGGTNDRVYEDTDITSHNTVDDYSLNKTLVENKDYNYNSFKLVAHPDFGKYTTDALLVVDADDSIDVKIGDMVFSGSVSRNIVINANYFDVYVRGTGHVNSIKAYYANDVYNTKTFKGAIRQTIKNIRLNAPMANIIFVVDTGDMNKNKWIDEVCNEYRIPRLHLYECGVNPSANVDYLEKKWQARQDGLHESNVGHEFVARAIAGEMKKYLW